MPTNIQCKDEVLTPEVCTGVGKSITSTIDSTPAVILQLQVPADTSRTLFMRVFCRRTDDSSGGMYSSVITVGFSDVSGTLSMQGSPLITTITNVPAFVSPVSVSVASNEINIEVTGKVAESYSWSVSYQYFDFS
jgi:hypothetical protein